MPFGFACRIRIRCCFICARLFPGTILVDGDKIEKLNTKTKETISALVYPSWHPSGKYVAFSVNTTKQAFHLNDRNRVEVYDEASDVVVYDVEKHEIVTASNIFSKDAFETFPTFSPDGKTLYFCTAEARPIPQEYSEVKYNLCSVSFDPVTRAFGAQVDTLYNAKSGGMSASFPRVSPDGRYLLYTLSGYGNFSIWHKDADLYMADLQTGTSRPLVEVNSDDVESYHSWSSNSRWFVFSSRRIDGLYTRPYIAYVDEDGNGICDNYVPGQTTGQGMGVFQNRGQNYVDEDNDGVCDNYDPSRTTGRGMGVARNGRGRNFVDADGAGICDNLGTGQGRQYRGGRNQ